ncbi:unnamed protein product, partial [Sphacelaria rigidula]
HPFLLPNLVGTLLALIVLPMVVFYLPETKNTEKARAKNGHILLSTTTTPRRQPHPSPPPSAYSIIGSRRVGCQRNAINEHTDTATSESHQGTTNEPAETARQGLSSNADSSGNNGACIDGHTAEDAKAGPRRAQRETADSSSAGDGEGTAPTCGCGPDALINTRHVKMILVMICFMSMAGIGLDETFPLWALSTTNVGGLGWITSQIGQAFGIAGILVLVYNILVFPRLARRVGMVTVQRVGAIIVIPAVLAIPSLGTVSPD